MATSSVMADFARMPAQRKAVVFIAIGAVLGLAYWKLVYTSLDERLEAAQAEHDNKVQTNRRLTEDIPKYEELRTHVAKLRELIEKNQTALPSEAELAAFIETLQHKVVESGVETRKWTYRTPEPVETFVKVPFEVEVTGTFMQIKRFFASLVQKDVRLSRNATDEDKANEEHDRIVSIENLSLTSPTVKNRDIILNAKFTAVTFRQEDKPAGAQGGMPGQPAVPGPSKPPIASPPAAPAPPVAPTVPPPPLPSAATPAGAKARVDSAVDKGDARNRNGGGVDEAKLKPPGPRPATGAGAGAGSDRLKGGL